MKKLLTIFALIAICACVYAGDFLQDTGNRIAVEAQKVPVPRERIERVAPEWEWSVEPQALLFSMYDYFHAYTCLPVSTQSPDMGGGTFLAYRTAESTGGVHNLSYSYVNASGQVQTSAGIGCEGRYGDCEVDYGSGDVFMSFHQTSSNCIFLYDLYHIIGSPGLWLDPEYTVLDAEAMQNNGTYPFDDDEFIWPKIEIGPSPLPDHRRVYVFGMNAATSHGSEALPSENEMICYADFTTADLEMQSNLEWSYRTIEQMDAWNAEDPEWARPQISVSVHDNVVILMGYLAHANDEPDDLLVLINENYGEGPFEMYTEVASFDQENPSYIDTESDSLYYLYSDTGTPGEPYVCKQDIIHSGHFNLNWNEDYTSISFAGSMGITFDSGSGPGYYYAGWNQIYPKRWTFDLTTHEFDFQDVYPPGANPHDDMPMQPWDLNEDGVYDDVYEDGMPVWEQVWPIYYHDPEQAFHANQTFTSSNQDMGWQVILWLDGTNNKLANDGITGYEDWGTYTEVAFVASGDYGETWSDPVYLNGKTDDINFDGNLENMLTCYMFPGDEIEIVDAEQGIGKMHLLFFDDEDFGSFVNGNAGLANGGTYHYAAINVHFQEDWNEAETNEIPVYASIKAYPNPFTPGMTRAGITAKFSSKISAEAEVGVYNVKGQKVAELYNDYLEKGKDITVNWNATNCAAGIYFFRLEQAGINSVSKVAVIK